jgi:hypothetical protein
VSEPVPVPFGIRLSLFLALVGTLFCFALLVEETPYTLTLFMLVGQPLLGLAAAIFLVHVLRDLRRVKLL